jgi:DNA repair protein SbcC/Rad50
MRPLRLLLDGFGSYREPAEADFSDVEFFALVGPTGAGKSTVIDGLCFALYGTVPRWGKENVISQALAPAANACRVCLVFESAGRRYGVVRALTRNARGTVHTKEARIELLDQSVPADAPLQDMLAASVEPVAEGPDQVKAAVQQILGLTYDHFTQSVLLPQGRFSEFLHAKAGERQDLLVELLAFGVYEQVGKLARQRAELAADRGRSAQQDRDQLAGATQEAEAQAVARVEELAELAFAVEEQLEALGKLRQRAEHAAAEAAEAGQAVGLIAAVQIPADVPDLARRIGEAGQLVAQRQKDRDAADRAEAAAQLTRGGLPDKTAMELARQRYELRRELGTQLGQQERDHAARQAEQETAAAALETATAGLQQARGAEAAAQRVHAAADLAQHLHIGKDCPVCRQPVAALPQHATPADLAKARAAVEAAEKVTGHAQRAHTAASGLTAAAAQNADRTRGELEKISSALADGPAEADATAAIDAIDVAQEALGQAQAQARAARAACRDAELERSSLGEEEGRARAALGKARDSVISLGAPAIDNADLSAAWDTLGGWARVQLEDRGARQPALDEAARDLAAQASGAAVALAARLTSHGITDVADLTRAPAMLATHRERAAGQLTAVQQSRRRAELLDAQIGEHRQEQEVAAELGRLLRATSFERWLCGEALDSLVAEASQTLMELSAGQYQLDRDERNELVVIDYQDAGSSRPVHTLSGGETFQASLALALALSRQVVGLSAGMRDLKSMFLDEGFGTLDEETLETVGSTLERLAEDSDRMIGIITHVPALAGRVPVRFVVSRTGTTSTLRKERG